MASDTDDDEYSSAFKGWVERYSEEELATILIVIGAILFLFPEPITSVIGVVVLFIGAATWFSDWLWG